MNIKSNIFRAADNLAVTVVGFLAINYLLIPAVYLLICTSVVMIGFLLDSPQVVIGVGVPSFTMFLGSLAGAARLKWRDRKRERLEREAEWSVMPGYR
jgi:hypothetical protein